MAEQIVHKSPSKKFNKSDSDLDSEIHSNEYLQQSPEIEDPIQTENAIPPLIREATVSYLPGPAGYLVGILEETVINLTRLHEDLSKLQELLVKGGVL